MGKIELSYVTITYKAPIVYFVYKEGAELGFPEIKELISAAEKLSEGKPYITFGDVRVKMNITAEGRRFVSNQANMPFFRGTAVVVKNEMYSMAANFMALVGKQNYPFRAFTDEEKAIKWLMRLPLR